MNLYHHYNTLDNDYLQLSMVLFLYLNLLYKDLIPLLKPYNQVPFNYLDYIQYYLDYRIYNVLILNLHYKNYNNFFLY